MTKPLRQVAGFLQPSAALKVQFEEVRRDQEALREAREALPPSLRDHCRRAVFSQDEITLVTESAVWATRLRFMAPEIVARLGRKHPAIRRCRVRITPTSSPIRDPRRSQPRAHLSQATAHHLTATAEMLTDPGLAAVFRRLAATADRPPAATVDAAEPANRSRSQDSHPDREWPDQ